MNEEGIVRLHRKEGAAKALVWAMSEALRLIEDMKINPYSGSEAFAAAKLVQLSERLQAKIGELASEGERDMAGQVPGVTIVMNEDGPAPSPETMREIERLLDEAGQVQTFGGRRSGKTSALNREIEILREAGHDARIVGPSGPEKLRGNLPASLRRLLDHWRRFFSRGRE